MTSRQPAQDVYHLEVSARPLPLRVLRSLGSILVGIVSSGEAVSPGNIQWHIVETASGRRLTTVKESFGTSGLDETDLRHDLETMTPAEFASRWSLST